MGSDDPYPKQGSDVGFPDRQEFGWQPKHTVELSPYCIDKFEVTVRRFKECVDVKKCDAPGLYASKTENNTWGVKGKEDHPVNMVSYEQAKTFCEQAGGRLPTEAEWEYAARGADGREYPWGPGPSGKTLTCYDALASEGGGAKLSAAFGEASKCFKGIHGTWQVNSAPAGASPFNVLDMAGNVMEWVEDRFDVTFYKSSTKKDPRNPPRHLKKDWGIVRGGGWSHGGGNPDVAPGWNSRTFWREPMPYWDTEKDKPARDAEIGFRCVSSPLP
jgi:formylglycine-generating enzyme required for sulfatase activity